MTMHPPIAPTLQPPPTEQVPANFGWRLLSWFIDSLIIGIPSTIIVTVSLVPGLIEMMETIAETPPGQEPDANAFAYTVPMWAFISSMLVSAIVLLVWDIAFQRSARRATPGKRLAGTRLVDAQSGEPASPRQVVVRTLLKLPVVVPYAGGIYLLVGVIMVAMNPGRGGPHDRGAGVAVVRDQPVQPVVPWVMHPGTPIPVHADDRIPVHAPGATLPPPTGAPAPPQSPPFMP